MTIRFCGRTRWKVFNGNTFTLTAEKSPIFVEDVRAVKLKMAAVNIYQNLHTQLS